MKQEKLPSPIEERIADKLIWKGEHSASGLILVLDRHTMVQIIKEVLNAQ